MLELFSLLEISCDMRVGVVGFEIFRVLLLIDVIVFDSFSLGDVLVGLLVSESLFLIGCVLFKVW